MARIIDAHVSIAPPLQPAWSQARPLLPTATPTELTATLNRFGIDKAVVFAPRLSGQDAYDLNYSLGNRAVYEAVREYPDRLVGFGRIYPSGFLDCTNELIRCRDEYGFRGLMLNGDRDFFQTAGGQTDPYLGLCQAWGWPVMYHIGTWPLAQPAQLQPVARRFPRLVIIGMHLGYDMINDAIAVAQLCPNVYLETSNASAAAIREAIVRCGAEKIIFGSGLPYEFPDHAYDKITRLQALSEADRNAILGGTMLKLLNMN